MVTRQARGGPSPLSIVKNVALFLAGVFVTLSFTSISRSPRFQATSSVRSAKCPPQRECPVCPLCPRRDAIQQAQPSVSGSSLPPAAQRAVGCPSVPAVQKAILPLPHVWCPHGQHGGGVDLTEKTLKRIAPGQLVIDVGAYDGSNAIMMARAGHHVLSFEPTPSKAEKIKRALGDADRWGMSGSVKFFPWAASNFSGTAPFVVNAPVVQGRKGWEVDTHVDVHDVDNLGSEQDAFAVPWKLDKSATVDVRVEMMDNVVPEGQIVLFMKVDAQGHDFRVLQGANKLLTEQRILVLLAEFAPTLMPGGWKEAYEMLEFIASKGYRCFGCGTTWPLGLDQGLPIDFQQWAKFVKNQEFEHRGSNHGQWDDIVCIADGARTLLDDNGY